MPTAPSAAYEEAHAPTPVATPTATAGTGAAALASPASLPQPMPVVQCTRLFTLPAELGCSSMPTVSATNLPSRAGAGASSKPTTSVLSSHAPNDLPPPSRRSPRTHTRSIARVAAAPATTPRVALPSRPMPGQRTRTHGFGPAFGLLILHLLQGNAA